MSITDPSDLVRAGYDRISYAYRADDAPDEPYRSWLTLLDGDLAAESEVLDLGCGCGIPATRILSERYRVTGVDISPVQIARARSLVPAASFICADMADLEFAPGRFAAIINLYAIIHVPLDRQPALIRKMIGWLRPGGALLIMIGEQTWTGIEQDWLGVEGGTMYWSHADPQTYRTWFQSSGCSILYERFIPEGDGGHRLVLARRHPNT